LAVSFTTDCGKDKQAQIVVNTFNSHQETVAIETCVCMARLTNWRSHRELYKESKE